MEIKYFFSKEFSGDIYVSILPGNELAFSWVYKNKKREKKDCGGYIFEHYKDEASEKIGISKAWIKSYQDPKYWDSIPEIQFRCNIRFYL